MKIVLTNKDIKSLLAMAISEGWLSKDLKYAPKVGPENIEFESEFKDGEGTVIEAIVEIGDFQ